MVYIASDESGVFIADKNPNLQDVINICFELECYLDWKLEDAKDILLPPLKLKQACLFQKGSSAIGFMTWAYVSENTMLSVLQTGRQLEVSEWNCGSQLYISDLVVAPGYAAACVKLARTKIFRAVEIGYALRRRENSSVRKISVFMRRQAENH